MKKKESFKKKSNKKPPTIQEARRYVANAEEILRERGQLEITMAILARNCVTLALTMPIESSTAVQRWYPLLHE